MSLNEAEFLLDEPSERIKRTLARQIVDLPDSKRRLLPTHLNQLDDLTLGNIINLLSTKEMLPLVQTSNWLLKAKINSQLRSLDFNRETLPLVERARRESFAFWAWPDLLTQSLPNLPQLSIDGLGRRSVAVRFDLLPPTLTGLAVSNCTIHVELIQYAIFTLPFLHDLTVISVLVNHIGYNMVMFVSDDQWLLPSVQHSPSLARVNYHTSSRATFHSLNTISSLPSIESLSINRLLIDSACWPPRLDTLKILDVGEVVSIPSTITRLQLPG